MTQYNYADGGQFDPRINTPQGPTPQIPQQPQRRPIAGLGVAGGTNFLAQQLSQLQQQQEQPQIPQPQIPQPQQPQQHPYAEWLGLLAELVALEYSGAIMFHYYGAVAPGVINDRISGMFENYTTDSLSNARSNAQYMLSLQGRRFIPHYPISEEIETLPDASLNDVFARTVEFKNRQLALYTELVNAVERKNIALEGYGREQAKKISEHLTNLNLMWEQI